MCAEALRQSLAGLLAIAIAFLLGGPLAAQEPDPSGAGTQLVPNECQSSEPAAAFAAIPAPYAPRYLTIGHRLLDDELGAGAVTPAMYSILDSLIDEGLATLKPLSDGLSEAQGQAFAIEAMTAIDCLLLRHGFVYPGHGAVALLSDGLEPILYEDPDDLRELHDQEHNIRRQRFIEARGKGPFYVADCDIAAYLYLAIAEVMKYPVRLVEIPRHNFVRWELGAGQFVDFETMDGAVTSDPNYIANWQIDIGYAGRGGILESMSTQQVLAYHDVTVAISWSWRGDVAKMIDTYERSIATDHSHTLALNNLAWFYAAAPKAEWRDGAKAMRYALQAVEMVADGDNLDTLACAYAQEGAFEKAIETEKAAIEAGYVPFGSDLDGDLALFESVPPQTCSDAGFGKDPTPFRPGQAAQRMPFGLGQPERPLANGGSERP
jgi:hypothetical protein